MPTFPTDEFEMTASARRPAPVWSPNPGVPIIARVLAYTFGGLMLLTIIATCLTPRAVDIPSLPNSESDWSSLPVENGCILYYPRGWVIQPQEDDAAGERFQVQFSLYPNSPVQVTAMLEELPPDAGDSIAQQKNDWLEATLRRQQKYKNLILTDGALSTFADNSRAFTFTLENRPMSGAWVIQSRGRFLLSLIGFAPRQGWQETQLIVSQMASRVECPE